jgi:hypothetical protein
VLLCSARGLKRLQRQLEDSLPSNLSSLYINQHFEDGVPCPVKDCPLNPSARVRRHDELTYSRLSERKINNMQNEKPQSTLIIWCLFPFSYFPNQTFPSLFAGFQLLISIKISNENSFLH